MHKDHHWVKQLVRFTDTSLHETSWICIVKGELQCKMNLWSNKTLVPSQPFSDICFHDNQM